MGVFTCLLPSVSSGLPSSTPWARAEETKDIHKFVVRVLKQRDDLLTYGKKVVGSNGHEQLA